MNEFLITLDIDWAPDFVVESVASELRARGVRATWFVTHGGAALDSLRAEPGLFELGLHPNFLPGSTHGATPLEVLSNLLALVPEAVSMRSHAVVQSAPILRTVIAETPLLVDSTLFLPDMAHIRPVEQLGAGRKLLRVPFFWADDHEMERSPPDWHLARHLGVEGLKVFLFHPIHLFLNSADFSTYAALKRRAPRLDLLTEAAAREFVNRGEGAMTLFRELADHLAGLGVSRRLRDIHTDWKGGEPAG